jgi:hypothetical protein
MKWIRHERHGMLDHDMTLLVEMPFEFLWEFPLEIYAMCRDTVLDLSGSE